MAHSVTMRTTELRRLLRSVSVFADQSKSALPVLNAVLLRGHGDYITATATDRYRLACQRVRPESLAQEVSEEIHALLPLVSVKAILQAFKSTRRSDPWATLTFERDTLQVSMDTQSATYALLTDVQYPQLERIWERAFDNSGERPEFSSINPEFLASFVTPSAENGKAVMILSGGRIDRNGNPGAIGVSIGENFRGVIMPTRMHGDESIGLDGDWPSLMANPTKVPSAA